MLPIWWRIRDNRLLLWAVNKPKEQKKKTTTGKALCQTNRPLRGPFTISEPAGSGPHPASFSESWQAWWWEDSGVQGRELLWTLRKVCEPCQVQAEPVCETRLVHLLKYLGTKLRYFTLVFTCYSRWWHWYCTDVLDMWINHGVFLFGFVLFSFYFWLGLYCLVLFCRQDCGWLVLTYMYWRNLNKIV